jgi:HD-GYP domain-containing protein (c-di-GMP phosphodiesterase class II)
VAVLSFDAPGPTRYPDRDRAVDLATEAILEYVLRKDDRSIDTFVRHEMHAASTEQIAAIVDTVCQRLLGRMQYPPDTATVRAVDLVRTRVSEIMADVLRQRAQAQRADGQIDAFLLAARMADPQLADHLERVGELAGRLAVEMKLSPERIDYAVGAGRLCRIGQLRVSRQILDKPVPLSAAEHDEIDRQLLLAAEELRTLPGLERFAATLQMHARGDALPLELRIVWVADAFVALTSSRCYRTWPYERSEALNLLRADRRCDRAVVEHLEKLVLPKRAA